MSILRVDSSKVGTQVQSEIDALATAAESANQLLHNGKGAGSEFLGWVDLPSSVTGGDIEEIGRVANVLRGCAEVIIVIGIGGSYLGSKAVLEALSDSFGWLRRSDEPTVVFAGQNISEEYAYELLDAVRDRSIAAIVVSKSGTTTEPAIMFRIVKKEIERRYGSEGAATRIVAVTDSTKGALKTLATKQGYETFVIPDNVGGRFSVLTPVGLLPLATAGVDISELIRGAADMEMAVSDSVPFADNIAAQYAAARNALYNRGYKIEILASYEPKLLYIAEWWKQLYGESEGKGGRGLFPASVNFTADLHSMGQYIQDGERLIFESVISVESSRRRVVIEHDDENLDELNFIAGKRLGEVNKMAEMGVVMAHVDGGVPNIRIVIPEINEYYIGALLYFFEKACGISGYMLGVNPFDQPGVEHYKNNMFALLGKPGYEEDFIVIKG